MINFEEDDLKSDSVSTELTDIKSALKIMMVIFDQVVLVRISRKLKPSA